MQKNYARRAVYPPRLKRMVDASVFEGIDPKTNKYDATLLDAKKDPTKTMGAIRSSARALDELIYSKILTDEWEELEKETCQNFVRGKCKLCDRCPQSHAKSGRNNKGKYKRPPSEIPCRHFLRERCNLGDKFKFSYKGKPKSTGGRGKDDKQNPLRRCKADLNGKKC